jgi:hypothetical protein
MTFYKRIFHRSSLFTASGLQKHDMCSSDAQQLLNCLTMPCCSMSPKVNLVAANIVGSRWQPSNDWFAVSGKVM